MKKVNCTDCGSEFEVYDSKNISIPVFRCEKCLKRR